MANLKMNFHILNNHIYQTRQIKIFEYCPCLQFPVQIFDVFHARQTLQLFHRPYAHDLVGQKESL